MKGLKNKRACRQVIIMEDGFTGQNDQQQEKKSGRRVDGELENSDDIVKKQQASFSEAEHKYGNNHT